MNRRAMLSLVVVLASLIAVACGGSNPAGPSGSGSVSVQGVVLGSGTGVTGVTASSHAQSAGGPGKVKVMVQGTTITAEVAANGTFQLTGVPSGSFVLVFTIDGAEIGRLELTAPEGSEVKVVLQIAESKVTVIEIKVETGTTETTTSTPDTCIIEGGKVGRGIELEGNVDSGAFAAFKLKVNGNRGSALVDVSASSASYKCNGFKGTDTECKALLVSGAKTHVRGTLMTCTTSAASVTATQVTIQK
jgi:hypothetical protein